MKGTSMLIGGVTVGSTAYASEIKTVVAQKENNKKDPANIIIMNSARLLFRN